VSEFIYVIRPTRPAMIDAGPTEREAAVVAEHFRYLERLAGDGVVRLAGRTLAAGAETFGIVILAAGSPEAAAAIMRDDPAVREGVMRAELSPFRVALAASGAGP